MLCSEKTDWLRVGLAVLDFEVKARCISCRSPSGNGKEVRRRVWARLGLLLASAVRRTNHLKHRYG